ncbi:hypothetical protein L6R29_25755, partial [Myxococcota bacterium]|nr:hypothetical protein [Myxococcota bacterium]
PLKKAASMLLKSLRPSYQGSCSLLLCGEGEFLVTLEVDLLIFWGAAPCPARERISLDPVFGEKITGFSRQRLRRLIGCEHGFLGADCAALLFLDEKFYKYRGDWDGGWKNIFFFRGSGLSSLGFLCLLCHKGS